MTRMRKPIISVALSALAVCAFTYSSFTKVFNETYDVKSGSKLASAKCTVCHIGAKGPKLNAYGNDLKKAGGGKLKKLTPEVLKAVGKLSSAGDGKSNDEKIAKDLLPAAK